MHNFLNAKKQNKKKKTQIILVEVFIVKITNNMCGKTECSVTVFIQGRGILEFKFQTEIRI